MNQKIRAKIFERDGYRCASCLTSNNLTIQHRVSKGMGGSKLYDKPSYLVTLCLRCNTMLESDSKMAQLGRRNGWKISRNAYPPIDPSEVPIIIGSRWYLIDNDFNRKEIKKNAE